MQFIPLEVHSKSKFHFNTLSTINEEHKPKEHWNVCLANDQNLHQKSMTSAAMLRISIDMHTDQEYGKSIMTSHENSDRDKASQILII